MAIQVAIVGIGPRGRSWGSEVGAHPGFELAACVDEAPETLLEGASSLGVPPDRRFPRLDQALDTVACDAVIVATSADRHLEPSEAALSRGLGTLVEKPFAQSLDEAVRLVDLGEKAGAPIVVAQNYRYMRAQRAARRIVREGVLGRVGMAVCHYYNVPRHLGSHAAMPHGALWGMGVHNIDSLTYVLGQRITGVIAEAFTTPWGESPEGASMEALLTMDGGARATYTASYESSGHEFFERGQEYYGRFMGERGSLHVYHRWLILCQRGKRPRLVRRGPRSETEDATLLGQLRQALLYDEEPESSGRVNLQTMAAVEACVRSSNERRWVNPQDLLASSGGDLVEDPDERQRERKGDRDPQREPRRGSDSGH